MQIYAYYPYKLVKPNMRTLYRIKYSNSKIRGTNNYRLLKLALRTKLVYPYIYSYS
jgi:hypothetical protein